MSECEDCTESNRIMNVVSKRATRDRLQFVKEYKAVKLDRNGLLELVKQRQSVIDYYVGIKRKLRKQRDDIALWLVISFVINLVLLL